MQDFIQYKKFQKKSEWKPWPTLFVKLKKKVLMIKVFLKDKPTPDQMTIPLNKLPWKKSTRVHANLPDARHQTHLYF